jgi:hypothetical protein
MYSTEKMEQIKEKLRKLQEKYEGSLKINSEHEAYAAASAIQAILLKYNLTMECVEAPTSDVDEQIASFYTYKFIGGFWEYYLMVTVCRYNFCQCFLFGDKKHKKMIYLGKKENMEVVKWLHSFLAREFVNLGNERYKKHIEEGGEQIGRDTYLRRYLSGCCVGLESKLKAEQQEQVRQEDAKQVTTLVVNNEALIKDYLKNKYTEGKKAVKTSSVKTDTCFQTGYSDGKNMNLAKPLKS